MSQRVLDDRRACKEKAVPLVGLVVRHPLSHPVWNSALVGSTHLIWDICRADVGDNRLLRQLKMSNPLRKDYLFSDSNSCPYA